jgi:purine nucleoside permease
MAQYKVTVTSTSVGSAGTDNLLVLSDNDNEHIMRNVIIGWAYNEYAFNVSCTVEKLNNSNQAYMSDLNAAGIDKIILL